MGHAAINFKI